MSPARELTLGIDDGTTGVRAAVVDGSGAIVGLAYREIRQRFPHPGWVEQDAREVQGCVLEVVTRALGAARARAADVAALGITNQRGSAVLFGDGGAPLGPLVTWQDQRTRQRCDALLRDGVFVSPYTAASKYEWLARHHAADRAPGGWRLGTVDAWLAHWLTGDAHVSDHSNHSASGLYDLLQGCYDDKARAVFGLEDARLPGFAESSAVIGTTRPDILGATIPVASLSGDQHAAMYGLACHAPGTVKLSLGTSGMMDLNAGTSLSSPGPGAYPLVLWSLGGVRSFCFEGTTITAGASAQWLRDGLGFVRSLDELEPLAGSVESTDGVWAVPALQGLGTPHLDANARGMIGGLSRGTTKAHVARAILEGVAWRCGEVFAALTASTAGGAPAALRVDGGAARNDLLLQMVADAVGVPAERQASVESAALGAALLAGRAVGLWRDEDVAARFRAERTFEPRLAADARAERLDRWRKRIELVRAAGA
ncbi:MAG: glycerol kinase [Deltaproteobacteria bacterium]|nr:glycerol kinase [Deltaproteobacteria bacterium]